MTSEKYDQRGSRLPLFYRILIQIACINIISNSGHGSSHDDYYTHRTFRAKLLPFSSIIGQPQHNYLYNITIYIIIRVHSAFSLVASCVLLKYTRTDDVN